MKVRQHLAVHALLRQTCFKRQQAAANKEPGTTGSVITNTSTGSAIVSNYFTSRSLLVTGAVHEYDHTAHLSLI